MSFESVISLSNVSKTFRIYANPWQRLAAHMGGGRGGCKEFHALNDVSFDVFKGEAIGIIGKNGSGKSTLLQIICGIRQPTSGKVNVEGRISALLELGSGFQPEFSGRDNVFLQGAIQGLSRAEMEARFDGIMAFADIGEFMDQPVRIYSSGMFVRLAFAVAVSVGPDILVVDEALAVGDAGFRSRCFRRIAELRDAGCTILSVSHDMSQIIDVCNRVMLVDGGEMLAFGEPRAVVAAYYHLVATGRSERDAVRNAIRAAGAGAAVRHDYDPLLGAESSVSESSNGAVIESVIILDKNGRRVNQLKSCANYRCVLRVRFTEDAAHVRFSMLIRSLDRIPLGGAWSAPSSAEGVPFVSQGSVLEVEFDFRSALNQGIYTVDVSVASASAEVEYVLHGIMYATAFRIDPNPLYGAISPLNLECQAQIRIAQASP